MANVFQPVALLIIRAGRKVAKQLRLEENSFVLAVHQLVLRLGFGRQPMAKVQLLGREMVLANDLSILPGLLNQTYEPQEQELVRRLVKQGHLFVDVGANFGLYTVLAAQLVGPGGRVVAFEPAPETFAFLRQNTAAMTNIQIEPLAVGDRPGELSLGFDTQRPGCATAVVGSGERRIRVKVVTLADYLRDRALGRPDFIKIDVEGYEEEVIRGLETCLAPQTKILCEFNPNVLTAAGREPQAFLDFLTQRFQLTRLVDEQSGELRPIRRVEDLGGRLLANLLLEEPRSC